MKFKELFKNLNEGELPKNSALEEKQVVNEKEDVYSELEPSEISKLSANLRYSHDMDNEEHKRRLEFYAKYNPTLLADMERWN